jgi:uncharacterized membrane protein
MMRFAFWLLTGLIGAGLVHGISVLMIPFVAPANAYARLAPLGADGKFVVVPAGIAGAANALPFEDATFIDAVCRFDLLEGPVRVFVPFEPSYGSITFYTQFGQAFYSLTDRAAGQEGVNIVLLDQEHVDVALPTEGTAAGQREALRIVSPTHSGFMMLRLHVPGPSHRTGLEQLVRNARCAPAES